MEFLPSKTQSVGIELELQLLDADTLALTNKITPLIELFPGNEFIKPEMIQSCVELTTPICDNTESAALHLLSTVEQVIDRCRDLNIQICGGGTHPFDTRLALITKTPRYLDMKSAYGITGRNQLTFATHVHVGMPSANMAIFVMRHLTPCIPMFLAIAANSPFWRGHNTGYASYRQCILAASHSYGLPPYFEDWDDFTDFLRAANRANLFESVNDIHWDIRPRPSLGTLELRVMDSASTIQDATAIAAFARSLIIFLIEHANKDLSSWPLSRLPHWVESTNRFQAALHGIDAQYIVDSEGNRRPIRAIVQELLDLARSVAARAGELPGIERLNQILNDRLGYEKQKTAYEQSHSYYEVSQTLVERLLEESVRMKHVENF